MYRPLIFISQTEVQVQIPRNLPGILRKEVEAVHQYFPLLVAAHDRGLVDETGHEVSKSYGIGIDGGVIEQTAPRPLRAGEIERAAAACSVEGIDACLAYLSPKTHLMLPAGVGKRIGEMPGDNVAAGIGREPGALKCGNGNERGTFEIRRSHSRVET